MSKYFFLLVTLTLCVVLPTSTKKHTKFRDGEYTNVWAVEVHGGEKMASKVAAKYGFVNKGRIYDDYYEFEHAGVQGRMTSALPKTLRLKQDSMVVWTKQQVAWLPQKKRIKMEFNDPKWREGGQWYLSCDYMNVEPVWAANITGNGVLVALVDDGLDKDNVELRKNFDFDNSFDYNGDNGRDPSPTDSDDDHGTKTAGIIGAEADNSRCIVGVAYGSDIAGIRLISSAFIDVTEAKAMSHNYNDIDVYSHSWGPKDSGRRFAGPQELSRGAMYKVAKLGRGGKGGIIVFASGNGGDKDNCNCDGYQQSIYTISVGAADRDGGRTHYSEFCASTLVSAYGGAYPNYIMSSDLYHGCTERFSGTSASTPLIAGVIALALEANPSLTWRDVQHLLVESSSISNQTFQQSNGAGKMYSHHLGYGIVNAEKLVNLANNWNGLGEQRECKTGRSVNGPFTSSKPLTLRIDSGCFGTINHIRYVEHVQVQVDLRSSSRGDTEISITSPMKTESWILRERINDKVEGSIEDWVFLSTHFWGEDPSGTWEIKFMSKAGSWRTTSGHLKSVVLIIYGTFRKPDAKPVCDEQCTKQGCSGPENYQCRQCKGNYYIADGKSGKLQFCVESCPTEGWYGGGANCSRCHDACASCNGSARTDCITCASEHKLVNGSCTATTQQLIISVNCSFEELCSWRFESNASNYMWQRHTGRTESGGTGPSADHTSGYGSYIYAEASSPAAFRDEAYLWSIVLQPKTQGNCFSFWYHMYGDSIGSLRLESFPPGSSQVLPTENLWLAKGDQGNNWNKAEVSLTGNTSYVLRFTAVRGGGFAGDIALDDIHLGEGYCRKAPTTPPPLAPGGCGGQYNATAKPGYISSPQYSFSYPPDQNCIYSIYASPGASVQLTFISFKLEYHASCNYDSVTIYYDSQRQKEIAKLCGTAARNQTYRSTGPTMVVVFVSDSSFQHDGFQAKFVAKDSACEDTIDNCWRYIQYCTTHEQSLLGKCNRTCGYCDNTTQQHIGSANCSFEDVCFWQYNSSASRYTWRQNAGSTASSGTGPSGDHTSGHGVYIYAEASSPAILGDRAYLSSSILQPKTQGNCLSFWYHMYGYSIGSLRLDIFPTKNLWLATGDQGNYWNKASVSIASNTSYVLRFTAVHGSDYAGDIALDDIYLVEGYCKYATGNPTTNPTRPQTTPATPGPGSVCGGEYNSTDIPSYITSPRYPLQYPQDQVCTYRINATTDHTVKLTFVSFQLEHDIGCDYDSVTIYYDTEKVKEIAKVCGTMAQNKTYQSTGPTMVIVFKSDSSDQFKGFKAQVTTRLPITTVNCSFEELCSWRHESSTSSYTWRQNTGSTASSGTGPLGDHTSGYGSYVYAEASSPAVFGHEAYLWSIMLQSKPQGNCFSFWYHMRGITVGSLRLDTFSPESSLIWPTQNLWVAAGNQGNEWSKAEVSMQANRSYLLRFTAVRGTDFTSDIALDDIYLTEGYCKNATTMQPPITSVNCSFEELCLWRYDSSTSSYTWRKNTGSTSSTGTGPLGDHTSGYGSYIYAEASSPALLGHEAYVWSMMLQPKIEGNCFAFWYHMHGATVGSLSLDLFRSGSSLVSPTENLWLAIGYQGNKWHKAKVSIAANTSYLLRFTAVRGSFFSGDIALDDIYLTEGYCKNATGNPTVVATMPATAPVPTTTNYQLPSNTSANCSFERICSWRHNSNTSSYTWRRNTGSTASSGTGPSGDHTSGYGSYVYAEASGSTMLGHEAYLSSIILQPKTQGNCFSFWYHMYGATVGSLRLDIFRNGTLSAQNLWLATGDQGDVWNNVEVSIMANTSYLLRFTAVRGSDFTGDIALDDIRLTDGDCRGVNCSFEESCSWGYGGSTTSYSWRKNTGPTLSIGTGPLGDHTSGSGSYVYAEASSPATFGHKAYLSSIILQPKTQGNCFSFWYHMHGAAVGSLSLDTYHPGSPLVSPTENLWLATGDQGNAWNKAEVSITANTSYLLRFTAVRGSDYTADIALDDINLTEGYCRNATRSPTTTAATPVSGCGGEYNATRQPGYILSPRHPSTYPPNQNCIYRIYASLGTTVKLTFISFQLESDGTCSYDSVTIYYDNQRIAKVCDTVALNRIYHSTGSTMVIIFKSDDSFEYTGFKAQFEAATAPPTMPETTPVPGCGGEYNATGVPGYILSPRHPSTYPPDQNCIYTIYASLNTTVKLTFISFQLEDDGTCSYDSVTIYDDSRKEREIRKVCGTVALNRIYHSTGSTMVIVFKSDGSVTGTGFRAQFEAVPTTTNLTTSGPCGGEYNATEEPGYISSPRYPSSYPPNQNCIYRIYASPGKSVKLTFISFELEGDQTCNFDSVSVYYDHHNSSTCGTPYLNLPYLSWGSTMVIKFKSDSYNEGKGFKARFEAEDWTCQDATNTTVCRGIAQYCTRFKHTLQGRCDLTCQYCDINECDSTTGPSCHVNATCNNTISNNTHTCDCKTGFHGNGTYCEDIDECMNATTCHEDAYCENTIGSFICTCHPGYSGDGKTICSALPTTTSITTPTTTTALPTFQPFQPPTFQPSTTTPTTTTATCATTKNCTNCVDTTSGPVCSCGNGYYLSNDQCKPMGKVYSAPLVLAKKYKPAYSDPTSPEFIATASEIEETVQNGLNNPHIDAVKVTKLQSGSLIATLDFIIYASAPENATSVSVIENALVEANNAGNFKAIGAMANQTMAVEEPKKCDHDYLNSCHRNANCTNVGNSYRCSCRNGYIGDGVDNCADDELSRSMLCHSSGYCWCVDAKNGKETPGTRVPLGERRPNCRIVPQSYTKELPAAEEVKSTSFQVLLIKFDDDGDSIVHYDVIVTNRGKLSSLPITSSDSYTNADIKNSKDGLYLAKRITNKELFGTRVVIGRESSKRRRRDLGTPIERKVEADTNYAVFIRGYVNDDTFQTSKWYPIIKTEVGSITPETENDVKTWVIVVSVVVPVVIISIFITIVCCFLYQKKQKNKSPNINVEQNPSAPPKPDVLSGKNNLTFQEDDTVYADIHYAKNTVCPGMGITNPQINEAMYEEIGTSSSRPYDTIEKDLPHASRETSENDLPHTYDRVDIT